MRQALPIVPKLYHPIYRAGHPCRYPSTVLIWQLRRYIAQQNPSVLSYRYVSKLSHSLNYVLKNVCWEVCITQRSEVLDPDLATIENCVQR
jgi:hypothetical protein